MAPDGGDHISVSMAPDGGDHISVSIAPDGGDQSVWPLMEGTSQYGP